MNTIIGAALLMASMAAQAQPASPSLRIALSDTNVVLAWRDPSPYFQVQETARLPATPALWSDVAQAPTVTGSERQLILPRSAQARYYRLCQRLPASARIFVNVPGGLTTYSGVQPVTFGVPFPRGVLRQGQGVAVVDLHDNPVPAQFEVLATWDPLGTTNTVWVKWVLVDLLVGITNGRPPELHLKFGRDVPAQFDAVGISATTGDVTIDTGAAQFTVGSVAGLLGTFALTTGDGTVYTAGTEPFSVVTEKSGPIRSVLRADTDYQHDASVIAHSSTRFRFWNGLPIVRIFHTVIWESDDSDQIADLRFTRSVDASATAHIGYASDGLLAGSYSAGRQIAYNTTEWDGTTTDTGKLEGWINVASANEPSVFLGLRWPWQQFPVGFQHQRGKTSVIMIGPSPSAPMSLKPLDVAPTNVLALQPDLFATNSVYPAGPYGWEAWSPNRAPANEANRNNPTLISPRGIARTFEITLWLGDAGVAPEIKNTLIQHPVFAYIDPAFGVEAGLPSPSTPAHAGLYPELETAMERVFGFVTKAEAGDAERNGDDDFGTWNWGDVQWQWLGYQHATYRYWMNNGKGWSIAPWMLFVRSGDRRYREFGEANARHVMDVDTCHVPETAQFADDVPAPTGDWKFRGGVYSYSELHWSYGPVHEDQEGITGDSEYLLYYYYLTGYERARDVIRERIGAVHGSRWGAAGGALETYYPKDNTIVTTAGRYLYAMLLELCVLSEASWNDPDPVIVPLSAELHDWASQTLERTLFALYKSHELNHADWFPGITSNHYLSHPLNVAARVLNSPNALASMDRWESYLGSSLRPGFGGAALGPMSVWSLATLQATKRDPNMAIEIDSILRARADTILRLTPPPGTRTFEGMGPFELQEAGPFLRDFVTGIWSLAQVPPPTPATPTPRRLPMSYFGAQLPMPGHKDRQIAFLKKSSGTPPVTLTVHFDGFNAGTHPLQVAVNVYNPDGAKTQTDFAYQVTFDHLFGTESVALAIPANSPDGIYAVEVIIDSLGGYSLPMAVRTSPSCPVVHYVPLAPAIVSLASPAHGGEFWLKPQAAGIPATMTSFTAERGRAIMLNAAAVQVAESEIDYFSGTVPIYAPLTYTPADQSLLAIVLGTEGIRPSCQWRGIRPYLSGTAAEWFDPTAENPGLVSLLDLPNL